MNTHAELSKMTNNELVAVHNGLAEQCGANDLKSWKGKKDLLIDRIIEMREQVAKRHPEPMFDDDETPDTDESIDAIAEATDDEFERAMAGEPAPVPDETEAALETLTDDERETLEADDQPKRTIKAASVELLCAVSHYEDRDAKPGTTTVEATDPKARSVGFGYDEIIDRLMEEFPDAGTSVACLRWYAVKIRVGEHGYEDLRLPQRRPRAKPKTAK